MKTKHFLLTTLLSPLSALSTQAQHSLTQVWSSAASLPVPESVLYSAWDKELYVAQTDGKSGGKDGKGGIVVAGGMDKSTYGTIGKLLDTSADKTNSADIGYDPVKKIVYVPTFMENNVVAYQLK